MGDRICISSKSTGQIVIFTERILHKALSNDSTKERWAVNGRYLPPSVQIYPQRLTEDYMDDFNFNTRKHFCILVSGRDDYGINNVHDSYHASNNGNPISKVNEKE